uniref:Probable ATP-dependent transporter ycf16 n=1 Tax=Gronococcus sybilensis TaxID=3028029 RepID=A0A9Y1I2F7_9RHOD|nr:manganese transport system ATP-binding protein [Gronococcus sybilensis]
MNDSRNLSMQRELIVQDLSVCYKNTKILNDINFITEEGRIVGIIGPNGAGKSTLFKSLLGINRKNTGKVLFGKQALSKYKREIAYVPQRSQIDWNYPVTVWDIVMMGQIPAMGWLGNFSNNTYNLIEIALDRLGIENLKDLHIGELSGGQQQRVFIARAIAQQASILLLDEPLAGIDYRTQNLIIDILKELAHRDNKLILIINHDLGDIIHHFDELLLINKVVIKKGAPTDVLQTKFLDMAYGGGLEK